MRRCKDDWVNATQILKCCNFPKAKRTKILEKGVQQGLHEKIQGGYGRFQGTWIPLEDARRLAVNYGVTPEIAPVLYIDTRDPNIVIPKKVKQMNKDGTPIKRKYTKKAKKIEETPSKKVRTGVNSAESAYNSQLSYNSYTCPPVSRQGPSQVQFPVQESLQMPQTFSQAEFFTMNNSNMTNFSQYNQSIQNEFHNYQIQLQRLQDQQSQGQSFQKLYQGNVEYPPLSNGVQTHLLGQFHHTKLPLSQSTNEAGWSQDEHHKDSDTSMSSNEEGAVRRKDAMRNSHPLKEENYYATQLLKFFSEDSSRIPYFLQNPPMDFNINEPIDDEGHTPLHWASSIGNYSVIHLLIAKGANPLVVNNFGLNPLSKLISFNNCYELKNFSKVLDDLELCLINTDINGRTPLHYLCQFSKVKSKFESLNYYLKLIIEKLTDLSNSMTTKSMCLLKNVIDHQDVNGDTCLHLAIKAGCGRFVKTLLGYNARDDLVNVNNESARYLIVKENIFAPGEDSPVQRMNLSQTNQDLSIERRVLNACQNQMLATPIQRVYGHSSMETPDTQRTTLQDDIEDERSNDINERISKAHFNDLVKHDEVKIYNEDDKENIFVDDSFKVYNANSTPMANSKDQLSLHHPLTVISEKTAADNPLVKVEEKNTLMGSALPKTREVQCPPMDKGNAMGEKDDREVEKFVKDLKVLPMNDLSSMVSGMINALSASYSEDIKNLFQSFKRLEDDLSKKGQTNELIFREYASSLNKIGIHSYESVDDLMKQIGDVLSSLEVEVNLGMDKLRKLFAKTHSMELSKLMDSAKDDDLNETNGNKIDLVVKLSNLQIMTSNRLDELVDKVKNYGIDSKMYKYRKLISLSCGLRVEDIDGLIDGIEESLMESS